MVGVIQQAWKELELKTGQYAEQLSMKVHAILEIFCIGGGGGARTCQCHKLPAQYYIIKIIGRVSYQEEDVFARKYTTVINLLIYA